MKIDEVERICEAVNNILDDLKNNACNVDTKKGIERKSWETYYGLDDELIKYIRKIEKELDKYKEVIDKIKEYAGELRLFDNESIEFEISNKILELLEEIE